MPLNFPKSPAQYSETHLDQVQRQLEAEDKKNVKSYASFVQLPKYAKASLPTQSIGGLIYVTDDVGGAVPAFSDGTNWRRVTDRAVIS
jgi:hypothetical protein